MRSKEQLAAEVAKIKEAVDGGEYSVEGYGNSEAARYLKKQLNITCKYRSLLSIYSVIRRYRAAKRKAAATAVPAGA